MATDDQQRQVVGIAPAPATFTVPGNGQIRPKAIFAHFDGSGAGGAFLPAVKITSDAGELVCICPVVGQQVAAGVSADVSWFPHVAQAAAVAPSSGIQYDVLNVGDWLNVKTNGAQDLGQTFTVDDGGGFTVTDNGDGGISMRGNGNGGISFRDVGNGGLQFTDGGSRGITLNTTGVGGSGVFISDTGGGGVFIGASVHGGDVALRALNGGHILLLNLPIVNPGVAGAVWNNGGVLNIS